MEVGPLSFRAEELTGYVIRWVADLVSTREGEPPTHVTLTCPAAWGDYRRSLMTEAASIAGLGSVGLISEPGAAATYYASLNRLEPGATIAVYDYGGGTFDAAILTKTPDGFTLRGTPSGDPDLGGTNFDAAILRLVARQSGLARLSLDMSDPVVASSTAQLRAHAVDAKEALSVDQYVDVPVIFPGINRTVRVSRAEFEDLIRDEVLATVSKLHETLDYARVGSAELTAVLLVGGSSRIPLVAELVQQELGVRTAVDAHPKNAVCLGAAIGAANRIAPAPAAVSTTAITSIRPPEAAASAQLSPAPIFTPPGFQPPHQPPERQWPPTFEPASVAPGVSSADGTQVSVNLAAAGLTTALDSRLDPVQLNWQRHRVLSRDEPLIVKLNAPTDDDAAERRRMAIRLGLLLLAAVLLVAAVIVVAGLRQ